MFLVSNFPQVPLATTNPATEGAAREQQLRQPLPAPEALAKAAAERSLDTERDKAELIQQKGSDKEQQQQQSSQQQDDSESAQQSYGKESLKALLAQARPTIDRPSQARTSSGLAETNAHQVIADADYNRFGKIICQFYNGSGLPQQQPRLLAST
ncbi:hypothetical protein [Ferrimonas lipolytica]|uniref:Uncharacterized protein n=1 Tax=Ferrimonas lipolytica TaxID=2724191 RepID=A0A6H1UKS6_9GAMM|nr:hypothetical protein [Ferrimonas lipolytica]QIZ78402.1 hypothetical protein HER31_16730 [Ferrimonas lipolytica]